MPGNPAKDADPVFLAIGSPKPGLLIWRIEQLKVVALPKEQHGKFYTGDSYIVLKTTAQKAGGFSFAIHFWLGKETTQDEAGAAAIKTVELDAYLGGKAVQYREVQGHETDLFLSYFRPCIIPIAGGIASGFKKPEQRKKEIRLWQVKGTRFIRVRLVPFARASLSHSDVYILDTPDKIFQFNGANSTRTEQGKALEVTQSIKSTEHEGKSEVAIIEDGKLGDDDSNQFWEHFGGYAPIAKKTTFDDDADAKSFPPRLIWSEKEGLKEISDVPLKRSMLDSSKCYLIDVGSEIYVWIGRISVVEERKSVSMAAENLILKDKRPPSTRITRVTERYETPMFKSNFDEWPIAPMIGDSSNKLKGMLKQAGVVDVKSMAKPAAPVDDSNIPPLVDVSGKIDVWRIDNHDKVPVPSAEIGKFYSGDCYIVQYTFQRERKNEYLVFFWLGRNSTPEEKGSAAILATKATEQLRGQHILARVVQGKEPEQFLSLFKSNLVFLKGGLGSSYKKVVGSQDDTYAPNSVALFHVKGTAGDNFRATQVQPVSKSLSSSDTFVLETPSTVFVWIGQFASEIEKKAAVTAAEFLRPGSAPKQLVEGKEVSAFWSTLGGKGEYPQAKEAKEVGKDARLFVVSNVTGTLKVAEVFNFTQDDLLSEDVMILDAYHEIFVWIGGQAHEQEKKEGMDIAMKYLDFVSSTEHRSKDTAVIKVQEGNEPPMFTAHFSWDIAKSPAFIDPYERKLAELHGRPLVLSEAQKRRLSLHHSDPNSSASSQRASALAAITASMDAGSRPATEKGPAGAASSVNSQRIKAMAALSGALKAEKPGDSWSSLSSPAPELEVEAAPEVKAEPEPEPVAKEVAPPEVSASSQRAAALAALSGALTAEKKVIGRVKPAPKLAPEPTVEPEKAPEVVLESAAEEEAPKPEEPTDADAPVPPDPTPEAEYRADKESIFPYSRLTAASQDPAPGIDLTKRESYLSDSEFEILFETSKAVFYAMPKWKRDQKKRVLDLF